MRYRPADTLKDAEVYREFLRISQLLDRNITGAAAVLHVAPVKPGDGDIAICDGVDWNPLGDGVKRPVWYDADTTSWKKFE